MTTTSSAASPASHTSGGDSLWRWIATRPPSQKTPPMAAARSRSSPLLGRRAPRSAPAPRPATVSGSFTLSSLSAWTLQRSSSKSSVDLEDAAVVVDADNLLEERRVAARERRPPRRRALRPRGPRRTARAGRASPPPASASPSGGSSMAAWRSLPLRRQPSRRASISGRARQTMSMGPRRLSTRYDEQLERVVVRPLQVVEHQDERLGALARVGLEEALDDRAPHRPDLLRRRPRRP